MPAEKIGNIDFKPDFSRCHLWQYDKAVRLNSIIDGEGDFIAKNVGEFWESWLNDIFNVASANDFGLALWGELLGVPWGTYDDDGTETQISTEMYRRMLLAKFYLFTSNGSIPDINHYLQIVFDGKPVFCRDNYDMTVTILSYVAMTTEEIAVLLSPEFLPLPAGVKANVLFAEWDEILGFNGSELQTLDNGTFVVFNSF